MQDKIWNILPQNKELAQQISATTGISLAISQVLINRGIKTPHEAKSFLYDTVMDLSDPLLWREVEESVDIIKSAIVSGKKILVFGDYDTDGICASAILFSTLKSLGANVNFFVPSRESGYGLTNDAIVSAKKQNISLIITVDCGIKGVDEVKFARRLGIDIIITDHHLPGDILPPANVVLNPKCNKVKYYEELSGTGVAFLLSWGIFKKFSREEEIINYLDLACIGTVGDVVPLLKENRILVKDGLKYFLSTNRQGIKSLMEVAGLSGLNKINADYHIAFCIAPRINSAGRMWNAAYGVELLLTNNESKAKKIAKILNNKNLHRQMEQNKILEECLDIISRNDNMQNEKVIIISNDNWHHGIIGIVASNIVEKFTKPSILLTAKDNGTLRGSARSIDGFDITNALAECSDLLLSYGGHKKAAGLLVERDKLNDFKKKMQEIGSKLLKDDDLIPKVVIDAVVNFSDINDKLVDEICLLEPYGEGNREPLFLCENVLLQDAISVGDKKHIKMKLEQNNKIIDAIWFDAEDDVELVNGSIIDIIFTPFHNIWQGERSIQLKIKGVRKK